MNMGSINKFSFIQIVRGAPGCTIIDSRYPPLQMGRIRHTVLPGVQCVLAYDVHGLVVCLQAEDKCDILSKELLQTRAQLLDTEDELKRLEIESQQVCLRCGFCSSFFILKERFMNTSYFICMFLFKQKRFLTDYSLGNAKLSRHF